MKFMEIIEKNLSKTVDTLHAKNKKLTYSNRVRLLLRNEYEALNQSYVALGKYYYENLRDSAEGENANLCNVIDGCKERITKIKADYEKTFPKTEQKPEEAPCTECEEAPCTEPEDDGECNCEKTEDGEDSEDEHKEITEQAEEEANQNTDEIEAAEENTDSDAAQICETDNDVEGDISEEEIEAVEEAMGIKDMSDISELPIKDSFNNLTESASVIDIKDSFDTEEQINIATDAAEDVIASAYSQVQESVEEEKTEDEPVEETEEAPVEEESTEKTEEASAEEESTDEADEAPVEEEPTEETDKASVEEEPTEEIEEAPVEEEPTEETEEAPVEEESTEETVEHSAEDIIESINKLTEGSDDVSEDSDEEPAEEKDEDTEEDNGEDFNKNGSFKFMNWNKLKNDLKDDIDYIVNDKGGRSKGGKNRNKKY